MIDVTSVHERSYMRDEDSSYPGTEPIHPSSNPASHYSTLTSFYNYFVLDAGSLLPGGVGYSQWLLL